MNEEYLERAVKQVSDIRVLVNGASRRAAQLARGSRPQVPIPPGKQLEYLDIALLEIAEGKIQIKPASEQAEALEEGTAS